MTIDPRPLIGRLVQCPCCKCWTIPLKSTATAGGLPILRDPDPIERRVIRAGMPPADYDALRLAPAPVGVVHFCSKILILGESRRAGHG